MQFLRRYWIATLVLLLVLIHAVIIGYVRSEANHVKVTASNEIPVGVFYIPSADGKWLKQLRIHVHVRSDLRMSAKTLVEMHRWQVHEVVEERLRQLDPNFLTDPALLEVKNQLKIVLEETLEKELIERIVITDRVDFPADTFEVKPVYDVAAQDPIYEGKPVFDRSSTKEVEAH